MGRYPVTFSPELLLKVRKIANIKSLVAEMLADVYRTGSGLISMAGNPGQGYLIAVIVHSSDYGG